MANTGKNSPLGINVTGDHMYDNGFTINPIAASHMGASKRNATYKFGSCVQSTCLRLLTWAIHDAYNRGVVLKTAAGSSVYDNLISIGLNPDITIPALGNSRPPTYVPVDPANVWARRSTTETVLSYAEQYGYQRGYTNCLPGPATSGYGNYNGSYGDDLQGDGVTDQKQNATWYPYDMTNPNHSITQWGWIRCHALQAWNEFNWNGTVVDPSDPTLPNYLKGYKMPEYKEFVNSFTTVDGYVQFANQAVLAANNGKTFLDGTYSNMNDLISADITGVSLSTVAFGTDLENLGMAINLNKLDSFGLPSNLLYSLSQQGAVTQDLSLVLLASGLTITEISDISSGAVTNVSEEQERKIYGAFLMMTGENLKAIVAPIQCRTVGLNTLADLLDVKKLFPNSYSSLTVPKYNEARGPTNSKTYYLIYSGGSVNSALDTPVMKEYVGTLVPGGNPPIYETSTTPKNYRKVPKGFDSYLTGILPKEQALAAGAFSFTMRQIRNVENFDIKQFAKVVKGIENVSDLPLTGGTSKPTNQDMIDQNETRGALGSGPFGSYTMSDFFGSMSGLPYPWKLVKQRISELETKKLYNIYNQLFLAVTWEGAQITVIPETRQVPIPGSDPVAYQTEYRVGSFSIANPGGGYGRGTAPDAIITTSNGGGGVGIVGRNDGSAASLGGGQFGRINSTTVTNKGSWQLSPPTATIQFPPTGGLPVNPNGSFATGGTNTSYGTTGWPQPMNQVVTSYIDQANQEIAAIKNAKPTIAQYLNQYWNIMGTQLMIEQRARYKALIPVAVPKDFFSNPYPTSAYSFTDAIPQLAQDTKPHMSAQTIEAITDMNSVGGQSDVAMMRQERNQTRLQTLGIEPDNDVPDKLSDSELKQLTTNGTLPAAASGSGIPAPITGLLSDTGAAGTPSSNIASGGPIPTPIEYTIPAWPSNVPASTEATTSTVTPTDDESVPTISNEILPSPAGVYNRQDGFLPTISVAPGDITPILNGQLNPSVGPLVPAGPVIVNSPYGPQPLIGTSNIDPVTGLPIITPNIDTSGSPTGGVSSGLPNPAIPVGTIGPNGDFTNPIIIIQPAPEYDPTNLPPNLDPKYTNSTLMPAVPSVQEAIDRVIECNCDCWID